MNFDQLLENYQRLEAVLKETNIALEEKEQVIEVKGETINKLQAQINQMQFQIDQMNRLLYGAKRERFIANTDENQLTLPFAVEQVESPERQLDVITYVREKNKRKEHPGRVALPSHLQVE